MSEQKPLIEEPQPTGPGKAQETCGTCAYQGKMTEEWPECFHEKAIYTGAHAQFPWTHPPALTDWPACRYYEIRRDR